MDTKWKKLQAELEAVKKETVFRDQELEALKGSIEILKEENTFLQAEFEAANEKIKELLGGEEAWLAFCDAENAKKENAVLKRALELAVQEGIDLHQVVGFDSNHGTEIHETDKEVIDRYRAEAEKGE